MVTHRAQCVGIHPLLHDRAGIFASLLYKAKKPSVCPSVCLSRRYLAIYAWIDLRFARNEAPILEVPVVSFIKVLIAVVRRLRRVECMSVDNFLLNLKQHSCKPHPRRINNIYYISSLCLYMVLVLQCLRVCLSIRKMQVRSLAMSFLIFSQNFFYKIRGSAAASLAKPKCSLFVTTFFICQNAFLTERIPLKLSFSTGMHA